MAASVAGGSGTGGSSSGGGSGINLRGDREPSRKSLFRRPLVVKQQVENISRNFVTIRDGTFMFGDHNLWVLGLRCLFLIPNCQTPMTVQDFTCYANRVTSNDVIPQLRVVSTCM